MDLSNKKIIFILVDALNKKYSENLGIMKYLGDLGTTFTNHRGTNTWTMPALGTLFSGKMAPDHHLVTWTPGTVAPVLNADWTFPEILKEIGFNNHAFASSGWGKAIFGLDRGFDLYTEGMWKEESFEMILNILSQSKGPAFHFIHLLDVHDWFFKISPRTRPLFDEVEAGISEESRQEWISLYNETLKEMSDSILEHIMSVYPPSDDTVIIFTTDHGECFFEYNDKSFHHGEYYTEHVSELMDLPLVIAGGPFSGKKIIKTRTFDYDLFPLIVNIACEMLNKDVELNIPEVSGLEGFDPRKLNRFRGCHKKSSVETVELSDDENLKAEQTLKGLGYL